MSIVATLIVPGSDVISVTLSSSSQRRLRELQRLVGGCIETLTLLDARCIVFGESGKDSAHKVNQFATALARKSQCIMADDYIAGAAVILPAEVLQ